MVNLRVKHHIGTGGSLIGLWKVGNPKKLHSTGMFIWGSGQNPANESENVFLGMRPCVWLGSSNIDSKYLASIMICLCHLVSIIFVQPPDKSDSQKSVSWKFWTKRNFTVEVIGRIGVLIPSGLIIPTVLCVLFCRPLDSFKPPAQCWALIRPYYPLL